MKRNKTIIALEQEISSLNLDYRLGTPTVSDKEYDAKVEELRALHPESVVINTIVGEQFLGEKIPLLYNMGSLDNIRTEEELFGFLSRFESVIVVTPKLDGISASRFPNGTYVSRGDGGVEGTNITAYCKYFDRSSYNGYQRGEIVISRSNFLKLNMLRRANGIEAYKTERSAVVGLMQSEKPDTLALSLLDFIPYTKINDGIIDKIQQLTALSELSGTYGIPYRVFESKLDVTVDAMKALYVEWSEDYEIDGLVIDVNDAEVRARLGYKPNNNPRYAMAYKVNLEEEKETVVIGINRQIGKTGQYTPVLLIEPVMLCGTEVSKINVDNERFILWNGIGVGSNITLKKSGNVIPRVTAIDGSKIISFKEFDKIAKAYGHDGVERYQEENMISSIYTEPSFPYRWDKNFVNIMLSEDNAEDILNQKLRAIEAFFSEMGIMDIGSSTVRILYEHGYQDVPSILNLSVGRFMEVPTFGKKKSENLVAEIRKRFNLAKIEKIMHASGCFPRVGSTRLGSIGFDTRENRVFSYEHISGISGIGDVMAKTIFNGQQEFWEFYDNIRADGLLKDKEDIKGVGLLADEIICFTGFRDKQLVESIIENGGEYRESINKSVTIVVYDASSSSSTKVEKAKKNGTKVMEKAEFYNKMGFKSVKNKQVDVETKSIGGLF